MQTSFLTGTTGIAFENMYIGLSQRQYKEETSWLESLGFIICSIYSAFWASSPEGFLNKAEHHLSDFPVT